MLKTKNTTYTSRNRIIFFIVYELDTRSQDLNSYFTLKDCLFGAVKIAKNADPDKYVYRGYGTGFDSRSEFSLPDGSMGKNIIIFGVDMSSSLRIDNKGKDILIFGIGLTQGLNDIKLAAETQHSINFLRSNRNFCLRFYNILYVHASKIFQFKAKDSEKNILYL